MNIMHGQIHLIIWCQKFFNYNMKQYQHLVSFSDAGMQIYYAPIIMHEFHIVF